MFKGIKLYVVVIVAVVLLAALMLGFNLYMKYTDSGLEKNIKDIDGVKSVKIIKDKVSQKIYVGIEKDTDLKNLYLEMEKEINKQSPQSVIIIQDVKGKSYTKLENAYDGISYYLYESMIKGDFPEMISSIQDKLKSSGINYTIKVDEKNIYVTMSYSDSTLYKVINYSQALRGEHND